MDVRAVEGPAHDVKQQPVVAHVETVAGKLAEGAARWASGCLVYS